MLPDEPTAVRPPEETPTVVVDASVRQALQLTPGAILVARYRIVSLIGRGGMGEVYRADDLKLGQAVALKFVSHHTHAARLLEEVRIGRQVSHPNVCRLYDVAEADGQLFITMEFVDGEDLASLLRRVGRLPAEKALAVARDICAGLAAAHEKGVIHRDLKPANVMIDGRGRARVTDFGLAVAGGDASDGAGTPAYMSPEQLSGASASAASDIYALGLVMYEIFTGRRAFASTSTHDLVMRQRSSDYTRPSALTHDVPAAVERLIIRCLDPEPDARPASLDEILRELPGDPLTLAIAAGETPSPAMVAAATKTGDLRPLAAWTLLFVVIAGFAVSAIVSQRTLLYRVAETKAPEVLQERAREILAVAGVTGRPADSDIFVAKNRDGDRLIAVYRQSRNPMRPRNSNAVLSSTDPPIVDGMATVLVDGTGQLLKFTIAPPRRELRPRADVAWEAFITAAGFSALRPTTPEWAADVDSDSKSAWLTNDGGRIEAASYHGRPVSFDVITADEWRAAGSSRGGTIADRIASAMAIIFLIIIPIAGLALARANLRKRQGDRAGAFRAAVFFGMGMLLSLVMRAHHPMTFAHEWAITSWHVAHATFWALMVYVFYIALEPLVRKRWPQILISWTRLIAGRFSDPMVGRDVLLGAAGAAIVIAVWHITLLVSGVHTVGPVDALGPAAHAIRWLPSTLAESLLRGFGLIILLLMMRAIVRNDVAASALTIVLIALMNLGDTTGSFALRALYALATTFVGVELARRFGMLAVMSLAFFALIQQRVPLTFESSAWYFGRSMIVMIVLAAMITYAFRTSLGTKRWLPRLAFEG